MTWYEGAIAYEKYGEHRDFHSKYEKKLKKLSDKYNGVTDAQGLKHQFRKITGTLPDRDDLWSDFAKYIAMDADAYTRWGRILDN